MTVGTYAKAIAAAGVAGLTAAVTALDDGMINAYEWTVIGASTLGALGAVWAVPNMPEGARKYGKAATSGAIAGLGAIGAAIVSGTGFGPADWVTVALAIVGGLGLTYAVPNSEWSDGLGPPPMPTTLPSGDAPGPFPT